MKIKRLHIWLVILALCIFAIPFRNQLRRPITAILHRMKKRYTTDERVAQYGTVVKERLKSYFHEKNVDYPPKYMVIVGLKDEREMEVWVAGKDKKMKMLRSYPILGMSGELGPKLNEGDNQVPEGLYRIESLNPNSNYHLALRVNYPNSFDLQRGKEDNRKNPGSDIMIHGNICSIGCLAMGDEAAEDLFILAAITGLNNISVILSPVDFRIRKLPDNMLTLPLWTDKLYDDIKQEMNKLQK